MAFKLSTKAAEQAGYAKETITALQVKEQHVKGTERSSDSAGAESQLGGGWYKLCLNKPKASSLQGR